MANDSKFNLTITINGKEVANTLNGVGKEIGKLKGQLRNLNESDPKFKEKQKELEKARERYGELKTEIDGTNTSLDEARGHWDNLMAGFVSGDPKLASEGLKGVTGNIKGMTQAAWNFIKTPLGAGLAVLATVGIGLKKWIDYNLEIEKTNKLVRDLTQEVGTNVDVIRIRAEGLKKVFDLDINQSVETAKSLAKGFGISYDEAFDIIQDGAIRGKLTNDEFLASLKQYPLQFKNAQFSATDFANIVNAGIDLSIYTDKLPDAIKEFSISVKDPTTAVKESLEGAFGKKFTDNLLKNVASGAISVKEAFALVSSEAERIGLNAGQAQKISSDLFRGAGEDAGGALKIFEAVNMALNEQKTPLTEIQQIQQDQLELNRELNAVQTQLFASGSDGLGVLVEKGKLFATQVLLKILKGGVDVYNWFVDLNNESGAFSAILRTIGVNATAGFEVLFEVLGLLWDQLKATGTVLEGVFTLNPDKIKEGFSVGFSNVKVTLNNLKELAVDNATEIYDAFNGEKKLKKINLEDLVSTDGEGTGQSGGSNPSGLDLAKEKTLLESRKKLYDKAEQELNALIEKQQEERLAKTKQGIEKELAAIDAKYDKLKEKYVLTEEEKTNLTLAEIETRENQIRELEDLKRLEKEDLEVQRDAEYKERLALIEEENRILAEEAKLEREAEAAATEEQRIQLLLDKTRYIALEQLRIEEEAAIKKLKLANATEAEIAATKEKFALKIAKVEDAFTKGKTKADEQAAINEQQVISTRRQSYADMFGNIAQLLGEHTAAGKAAAIAQATINTWQGVTEVWKAPAVLPEPFNTISKVAASGITIASGLKAVGAIKSTNTGFYEGGPTGDSAIYNDEYGAVTGVVHDNEWVAPKWMNESPRYAPTLRWLESERVTKKPFFNGGSTSPDAMSSSTIDAPAAGEVSNTMLMRTLQQLNEQLAQGLKAYVVRDFEEFLSRKEQDQENNDILNNTRQ